MSNILKTLNDPQLVRLLKEGKVGVMPTDTVYGLVCLASNQAAVQRLYGLKSREAKPGTLLAATTEQLVDLGVKARYIKPVQHYWPGPISIVIPLGFDLDYLHQGIGAIAMRVIADPLLVNVLMKTGPLLTTSANLPGEPTASTIQEAQACFRDQVDFYVNGGNLGNRQPSTIIRILDDAVEVLRTGAVKINENGGIVS